MTKLFPGNLLIVEKLNFEFFDTPVTIIDIMNKYPQELKFEVLDTPVTIIDIMNLIRGINLRSRR